MTEHPSGSVSSLVVDRDQPLIGLWLDENGSEVVRFFAGDAQADAALSDNDTRLALESIGAFSDLD